jgi:hypothetical protein
MFIPAGLHFGWENITHGALVEQIIPRPVDQNWDARMRIVVEQFFL